MAEKDILHVGQISEHNNKTASCRVAMDDFEGMVSGHMQMLFPASGHWNFFCIPKEGDHVAIVRLPNGPAEGYILGKPYTADNMPQGGSDGLFLMVSADGNNIIKFDALNGTMDIKFAQGATLKFKNLDITVEQNVNIKAENATLEASTVKITGGELETNGDVSPSGSGPYCGIKQCRFTGAPHVGQKVSGT